MRSPRIIQVSPNSIRSVLTRRGDTEEKATWRWRSICSYTAANKKNPKDCQQPPEGSRNVWNEWSLRASRRNQTCSCLISDSWPPELWKKKISVVFYPEKFYLSKCKECLVRCRLKRQHRLEDHLLLNVLSISVTALIWIPSYWIDPLLLIHLA